MIFQKKILMLSEGVKWNKETHSRTIFKVFYSVHNLCEFFLCLKSFFNAHISSNKKYFHVCVPEKIQIWRKPLGPFFSTPAAHMKGDQGPTFFLGLLMARLNIEQDAWIRIRALAKLIGWQPRVVAGTMAMIWQSSQEIKRPILTEDQIFLFGEFLTQDEMKPFLKVACSDSVRFFRRLGRLRYEVCGSQKQIDAVEKLRAQTKLAGVRRAESAKRCNDGTFSKSQDVEIIEDVSSVDPALHNQESSAIQCNSTQGITTQFNSIQDKAKHGNTSRGTAEDRRLAERWHAHALSHQPWLKHSIEKFSEGVARLKRSVGLTDDEAIALFEFIAKDEFWRDKALSPASLLKKSSRNDMRKVDNILSQMKKGWSKMKDLNEWINSDEKFDPIMGAR